jgi:MA3 domain
LLWDFNIFSIQGKVHNPTGQGVKAVSTQACAKAAKVATATLASSSSSSTGGGGDTNVAEDVSGVDTHETKTKEGNAARRNITRKKTADKDSGNFNSAHKKQGGHGKGQWKEVMDPSYANDEIAIDEDDPIFDAAEDSNKYILTSSGADGTVSGGVVDGDARGIDPGTSKAIYGPILTLQEFKFQLAECFKEYFDSCDADEVIRTLQELKCPEYHLHIAKKAISLALDNGPRERELMSRLLTCLHPTPLSMSDMELSFVALLDSLDELCKDVPDANVRNSYDGVLFFSVSV